MNILNQAVDYILLVINKIMERSGLNIMVFEEESSFLTEQSCKNTASMKKIPHPSDNIHQSEQIICSQLQMLSKKLVNLQQKTSKLQESVKINNYPTSASEISATTSNQQNVKPNLNVGQVDQLIRVIQQKIQIIIKETKNIIDRVTSDFDKKLNQLSSQKNHETKSITKIQNHYQQAITKMQEKYRNQMHQITKQQGQLQAQMIEQIQKIQKQFINKKRQFQNKQQEYIRTIQHLENKLRIANKNRKLLEVTQQKKQNTLKCNILDNISGPKNTVPQMAGLPASSQHQTSKRRHRIFDGRSSNRSISPNSQILSPLNQGKSQTKYTKSVTKPGKNTKQDQMPETQYSKQQRFQASKAQNSYREVHAVPIHEKTKGVEGSQKLSSQYSQYSQQQYNQYTQSSHCQKPVQYNIPNEANFSQPRCHQQKKIKNMPQRNNFIENSQISSKNQYEASIKSPIQQAKGTFPNQTPKGQWERFQDFNDNESSGSQQDVFFYPEHLRNKQQQPKDVFEYMQKSNEKLYSPFDLN